MKVIILCLIWARQKITQFGQEAALREFIRILMKFEHDIGKEHLFISFLGRTLIYESNIALLSGLVNKPVV